MLQNEAKIISSPVAFTAAAYKTVNFQHEESPYLFLATALLENKILHPTIREKGGAYGSGANYNPSGGSFYLYSYRDPHLAESLNAFKLSIEELSRGNFNDDDLIAAKLQAMQEIDAPIPPGKRASTTYHFEKVHKTKLLREKFRQNILNADKRNVQHAVEKNLKNQIEEARIVSFGNKAFFEKENTKLKYPLTIQTI